MFKKQTKTLSVIIITLVGLGFMLSTLAMAPNQETSTATPELSITNTEIPTSTPTATQTPTSTYTATYTPSPSATPTQIPTDDALVMIQTQNAEISQKLDDLKQNPFATHGANVFDNILSNIIWEILLGLASFFGLAKVAAKFKNNQDISAGRSPNGSLVNLEAVFGDIFKASLGLLLVFVFVWSIYYIGQFVSQSSSKNELTTISQKLDQIQNQLSSSPQTISTYTPENNFTDSDNSASHRSSDNDSESFRFSGNDSESNSDAVKTLNRSMVVVAIFTLLFLTLIWLISSNQFGSYESALPKLDLDILGRRLLPAVFLVLVFQLLPSPISVLILPVLIPYFLFAFFDIVLLYPNNHLRNIVVRYYRPIIFLSVFGVWLRAFQVFQSYLNIVWENWGRGATQAIIGYLLDPQQSPFSFLLPNQYFSQTLNFLDKFGWSLLPYLLALFYAGGPSKRIRKFAEDRYIGILKKKVEGYKNV